MQVKFEKSLTGAQAALAVLVAVCLMSQANADGLQPSRDSDGRDARCATANSGSAPAGCARISGYIPAGSEFSTGRKIGGRKAAFAPASAPVVTSVGPYLPGPVDSALQGLFFLQVSHDDGAR
jgi:hypothetical protein